MAGKSRERGQLVKKGPQKYLIRVYLGRTDGKRKYASKTVNGTKKEADAALVKWLRELDTNEFVKPQDNTNVANLMEEFLASKVNISKVTMKTYEARVEHQINPYIGFLKLSQVSELRLERLFKDLSERYAASTIQKTRTVLSQAFKLAVRRRYVQRNPVLNADLKRPKRATKGEDRAMTPEEVQKVLKAAEGTHYEAVWHLMMGTGMRPQEACALRWSDIEGDTVHIRRVLREWENRTNLHWVEGEAKTRQSLGSLHLPGSVKAALEEHKARQNRQLLRTGVRPEHDWIFLNTNGDLPTNGVLRDAWKATLKRAEVDDYRLYDCRHTHATQLLAAGVPLKSIQDRLRHTSITTTANVYAGASKEMDSKAAAVFDKIRAQAASEEAQAAVR